MKNELQVIETKAIGTMVESITETMKNSHVDLAGWPAAVATIVSTLTVGGIIICIIQAEHEEKMEEMKQRGGSDRSEQSRDYPLS